MAKQIKVGRSSFAFVDDEDAHLVEQFNWYRHTCDKCVYAGRKAKPGISFVYMHCLILDCPKGMEIDHIDGNGLNNQRSNLRVATHSKNLGNSRKHCRSSSQYKGVYQQCGKWRAQLRCNGQKFVTGLFVDERDAAAAYDQMAKEHFGEFAKINLHETTAA